MTKTPPLWLPEGSIRSILAILIVGATLYANMTGLESSQFLNGLAMGVIAAYFGTRPGESGPTPQVFVSPQSLGLPRADESPEA